jgi:hypothetical protein
LCPSITRLRGCGVSPHDTCVRCFVSCGLSYALQMQNTAWLVARVCVTQTLGRKGTQSPKPYHPSWSDRGRVKGLLCGRTPHATSAIQPCPIAPDPPMRACPIPDGHAHNGFSPPPSMLHVQLTDQKDHQGVTSPKAMLSLIIRQLDELSSSAAGQAAGRWPQQHPHALGALQQSSASKSTQAKSTRA